MLTMPKRRKFFTSDLHFNHPNIIRYCERPFKDVGEQDAYLIHKINETCSYNDVLYHIGDFMMFGGGKTKKRTYEYYADQINCEIIHVKGNHDFDEVPSDIYEAIIETRTAEGVQKVYLTHNPDHIRPIDGIIVNLTGHVHEKNRIFNCNGQYTLNVGVDVWNYQPISFEDIERIIMNYDNFFSGHDEYGEPLTYMPVINERWIRKADGYAIQGDPDYGHWVIDERIREAVEFKNEHI